MWLLIAFLLVPLIEIALFIQVGGTIGLWSTLAIVVITAILGTVLVRSQGAMALGQLRSSFSESRDPTEPLVHGAMILFSGALLLTPGFFTDAVGFALLVPAVRKSVFNAVRARMNIQVFGASVHSEADRQYQRTSETDVIEGEYHEIDPDDRGNKGPSGWTKH